MNDGRTGAGGATWWRLPVAVALLLGALATVFVGATVALGTSREPVALRWQNGAALLLVLAVAWPLWSWLHTRVHELADSYLQPQAALSALATGPGGGDGGAAGAIARAVNLPWVEIELDQVTSVGRRPDGVDVVTVPVVFGDETFGAVRVAARRRAGPLTAVDVEVIGGLARQLALRVAAERAAQHLAQSRAAIVAAREDERLRIRRDLHDGLSPSLASVQLQLTALKRGLGEDDPRVPAVEGLVADLRHAAADLRRVVYDLRPPLLDDLGLAGALAHQFRGLSAPVVHLAVDDSRVPAAVEVALLRIATEAVANAVKHARARAVEVTVAHRREESHLSVVDDGVGFAATTVAGVGLSSMRERAEELGGTLVVRSAPGAGTRVAASIGWSR